MCEILAKTLLVLTKSLKRGTFPYLYTKHHSTIDACIEVLPVHVLHYPSPLLEVPWKPVVSNIVFVTEIGENCNTEM